MSTFTRVLPSLISATAVALPATLSAGTTPTATPSSVPATSPWTYAIGITVKEGYDDNLYLQSQGDQAGLESWLTTVVPALAATYQPGPAFKAAFSYAPEITYYASEPSEDNVVHRGALNLGGTSGDTAWEQLNAITQIVGDDLGPTFTGGSVFPALGGIPLRERRDAVVYRNSFKLTQTLGKAFLRPLLTSYVHDFQTQQHTPPGGNACYENFIGRRDLSGGVDCGYAVVAKTWLVLGYRFGHQEQGELLGVASHYSNNYQRLLAGIEGAPAAWLKFSLLAGPDVRDFTEAPPASFDADETLFFIDASLSLTPTPQDTLTVAARYFEQPAYTSHSMYEDSLYEFTYRHKFSDRISAGVGFKVCGADWQPPVVRDDWVYTPSATLVYTHDQHLSAELAYSYDWADSELPNTNAREYTHNLVSLGLKYLF